ncbi:hypothetical protein OG474_23065 [Kribbella sp. NBC_01505]|uniref:hypothetical protein n=1 Tax=Kribbella sp. NBC_01505 TaxID=2903580 RepID=UPI0038640BA8
MSEFVGRLMIERIRARRRYAGLLPLAAALAVSLALTACGSEKQSVDTSAPQSASTPTTEKKAGLGQIVESGFGQSGQYVWVTALVKNMSDHGGQTVTVNFNLLDKSGAILKSASQVESFNVANQLQAVGTQVDVGLKDKVASVQPTLLVKEEGAFPESKTDLGSFKAGSITKDQYVDTLWHAKFTIKNPTDQPLQSPRIGVICKGTDGKVNGGGTDYPDLVPPSGQVVIDPNLITTGKPTTCTAYVAAGI